MMLIQFHQGIHSRLENVDAFLDRAVLVDAKLRFSLRIESFINNTKSALHFIKPIEWLGIRHHIVVL